MWFLGALSDFEVLQCIQTGRALDWTVNDDIDDDDHDDDWTVDDDNDDGDDDGGSSAMHTNRQGIGLDRRN